MKTILPVVTTIPPNDGKKSLVVEVGRDFIQVVTPPESEPGPEVWLDWWRDHLQILVFATGSDEPVATVCFNPDGTVAEDQNAWRKERDKNDANS